jgi:hypothetical protein
MKYRGFGVLICIFSLSVFTPGWAQIAREARFDIIRTVLADQAAARIPLPFGTEGVDLTDAGQIDQQKLQREIQKNGQSVEAGKVVTVTDVSFDDNRIVIELDGGGKNKKSIFDRIQVGVGTDSSTVPVQRDDKIAKAKGSKIVLRFAKKVPPDLKPEQLRQLLDPVLDFNKHSFMKTGIEALPPEFQEAVKAKEARIGMDKSTVIMALGRPDKKFYENGTEQWMYAQRGMRRLFVTFENNVVVQVKQY